MYNYKYITFLTLLTSCLFVGSLPASERGNRAEVRTSEPDRSYSNKRAEVRGRDRDRCLVEPISGRAERRDCRPRNKKSRTHWNFSLGINTPPPVPCYYGPAPIFVDRYYRPPVVEVVPCPPPVVVIPPPDRVVYYNDPVPLPRISGIYDRGEILGLNDGSFWSIAPNARCRVENWLTNDIVIVDRTPHPQYPFQILNRQANESVPAQLKGGPVQQQEQYQSQRAREPQFEQCEPQLPVQFNPSTSSQEAQFKKSQRETQASLNNDAAAQFTILTQNVGDGEILQLADNSVWDVSPSGKYAARFWRKGESIEIKRSGQFTYPYLLTNMTSRETVEARLKKE